VLSRSCSFHCCSYVVFVIPLKGSDTFTFMTCNSYVEIFLFRFLHACVIIGFLMSEADEEEPLARAVRIQK
jgi:hypothetical protein